MNTYQCRISSHGDHQLEIGVVYPVSKEQDVAEYKLDAYIFTPYHLGIAPPRYSVTDFFSGLSSYIRYTPASIPLHKLYDPSCELSPLIRLINMLTRAEKQSELDTNKILYELRGLVNIYHSQLREIRKLIGTMVSQEEPASNIAERLVLFISQIDRFLKDFRSLRNMFFESYIPALLREGFLWADESNSVKTEKEYYRIYKYIGDNKELKETAELLIEKAEAEQNYRKSNHYQTVIDPADPIKGELMLYRESMLKKWAQTAMYMQVETNPVGKRLTQVIAGTAAAIAMTFAVVATFLAEKLFVSYSLPWALLIVVAYIFKDRIKELLRNSFAQHFPYLVADTANYIIDSQIKQRVGALRNSVRFCKSSNIPADVVRLRNMHSNPFSQLMPPENVLHFRSTVRLNCLQLRSRHMRLEAITNILRLKLDKWLENMDDPSDAVSFTENGVLREIVANRVYHINMIVSLSDEHQTAQPLARYRLVLNRNGIVRIEKVAVV
jgi:hypothetical protein